MFDVDTVQLLMRGAVEMERHGMLATDTAMALQDAMCCGDCLDELLDTALEEAI